jgi:ketosteroid isomerase-like protein
MPNPQASAKPAALGLADRFFAAIERCDMDGVRALYAPDALIWHNFDAPEGRLDRRRSQPVDDNIALLAALPRLIRQLRYAVWHEAATSTGFVRQHLVQGTSGNDEAVSFPVCVVADVEGERIVALYEYLNVGHLPAAVIDYFSQHS